MQGYQGQPHIHHQWFTMNIQLTGKRALVTGGTSGIGASIAAAFAEAGAKVAINYRSNREAALAMVKQLHDAGREALELQGDVADAEAVAGVFQRLDSAWGGIDILVNCAGIDGPRQMSWEARLESWKQVLEVNLLGSFYCAQQALRRMVPQRGGVVLNISSVHEVIPWAGYSAYAASKAGLGMMTKTLAQETAPHGVRIVAIAPGAIRTAINKAVWSDAAGLKDLREKIPLNRMGMPEEIARMAVVLASDVSSYVTGTTVFVDGGMTDYPDFAHGG